MHEAGRTAGPVHRSGSFAVHGLIRPAFTRLMNLADFPPRTAREFLRSGYSDSVTQNRRVSFTHAGDRCLHRPFIIPATFLPSAIDARRRSSLRLQRLRLADLIDADLGKDMTSPASVPAPHDFNDLPSTAADPAQLSSGSPGTESPSNTRSRRWRWGAELADEPRHGLRPEHGLLSGSDRFTPRNSVTGEQTDRMDRGHPLRPRPTITSMTRRVPLHPDGFGECELTIRFDEDRRASCPPAVEYRKTEMPASRVSRRC